MPGSFLLAGLAYGLDSFLVSIPLGAIELVPSRRRRLALAFGLCDGLGTGLGALLSLAGARFFSGDLEWIAPALIAGYGMYVMALGLRVSAELSPGQGSRLAFALPVLLSLDNFIGGSLSWVSAPESVAGAIAMGAISGAMSLAGLAVGAAVARRAGSTPFAAKLTAYHPRLSGSMFLLAAVAVYYIESLC
jgi:putative Mn2+ efflux pump MntP